MANTFSKSSAKNNHSDASWKLKYDSLLKEHKQLSESSGFQLNNLRRALDKISILATGSDAGFDLALKNLVEALKKDPHVPHIPVQIDAFSQKIIQFDSLRLEKTQYTVDTLIVLLDQLAAAENVKSHRKTIKKLAMQLEKERKKSVSLDEFELQHWLNKLGECQQQFIEGVSGLPQPEKKGFIDKLFNSSANKKEVEETVSNADNEWTNSESAEIKSVEIAEPTTQQADLSEKSTPANVEQNYSVNENAVSGEVVAILLGLLADIDVPESVKETERKLYEKLQQPLAIENFVSVLDDTVVVISAALRRDQADFEGFLSTLDERLVFVNAFLKQLNFNIDGMSQNGEALDFNVAEQVTQIRDSLDNATSIDALKEKVTINLDTVTGALRAFNEKQRVHIIDLESQLQDIKTQVSNLETESLEAKTNLAIQREKLLRDSLTNLPNREAYDVKLAEEFSRWSRYQRPLTFVMADIDLFKSINDSYGHAAGDKVLKLVAKVMRDQLRESDFVARYGGEEFSFILPETTVENAALAIEKVREAIERCPFNFNQKPIKITCSFGITSFVQGDSCETVFERADKALYEAKEQGRNRYIIAA